MPFEKSKFGDGSAAGAGNVVSQVHNFYGPRKGGNTVGVYETDGVQRELSIDLSGEALSASDFLLIVPTLPKGAMIANVYAEVSEAFVLGGTTPAIKIGSEGSEATNGISISEAQAEAVGNYVLTGTLAGTWASPLTATTTVGIALTGTSPTTTTAGKVRIVIRYVLV